jgi:hypothetical protein
MYTAKQKKAMDSTLSYFVNQLDNFDPKLHQPLLAVTWGRDIQLRGNITLANESTSFTRSTFGAVGTMSAQGKPFVSTNTTALPGVSINGERIVTPLRPLAREIGFTSIELQRSQLLGQPIDVQQMNALNQLYQLETDAMVYVGDSEVGAKGLLNSSLVTASAVANGASGSPLWINKTPDEILKDVNDALTATWLASAYALCPSELRLPPTQFALLSSMKVSSAGNVSVLTFLEDNSIALRVNGKKLNIQPIKWLAGIGAGSSDRMMVYTNDLERIRFPMVPIRRETAYYKGIHFLAPYVYGFGEVEFVYPETVMYKDGI